MSIRGIVAVAVFLFAAPALAQVEVTGTLIVNPIGHLVGAGAEFSGGPHVGLEAQVESLGYVYRDSSYEEDGSGVIAGLRGRWYPQASAMRDHFWIAGGLSIVSVHSDWWDYNNGAVTDSGTGGGTGVAPSLGLGWKFRAARGRLIVDPQLLLAFLAGTNTDTTLIAGGGASLGWRF